MRHILIDVEHADVLEFTCDVLALKHAQALYGVDEVVYRKICERLGSFRLPNLWEYALLPTQGTIPAATVLFVGVPALRQFGYQEIREFGRSVLASLATKREGAAHVALTLHGANYGLDEIEAFKAEMAGLLDALTSGECPESLRRVSFVEREVGRVQRLRATLRQVLPENSIRLDRRGAPASLAGPAREALRSAGAASDAKPRVFVAMPFAKEMDDLFHYGIQGAVNTAGFLCERADMSSFVGDVMDWVKARIETSQLVVADLSTANPNVYLEVGYAWGCRIPTVLIVRDSAELTFDVRGQRAIAYTSIKHLEERLASELQALQTALWPPAPGAPGRRAGGHRLRARRDAEPAPATPHVYYDRVPTRELRHLPTSGDLRAVVRAPKYWPNGSTLRVRLLGGTPAQHEAVRRHACEWTDYANLKLEYSTAIDAEIRVAFDPDGGSWSYEGTDAREVPLEFPTMNLASPDRATILHQFGRAIGLGPEHQNPAGGIAWNVPAVIRDLSGPPNYWDPETVEHQFLEKYAVDHVNGSAFDPQSIMVLPIPPEWTLNGAATTRNETLSWRDKELVKQIYPPPGVIGADPGRR